MNQTAHQTARTLHTYEYNGRTHHIVQSPDLEVVEIIVEPRRDERGELTGYTSYIRFDTTLHSSPSQAVAATAQAFMAVNQRLATVRAWVGRLRESAEMGMSPVDLHVAIREGEDLLDRLAQRSGGDS